MKISIFTPTHNTKHLKELYDSIKEQSFDEWLILTNNVKIGIQEILNDARVKIVEENSISNNVGALKRKACFSCSGDILVEVDHDDLLIEGAIDEIRKAFEDEEIGFIYSNSANFTGNFEPTPKYGAYYGWVHRDFNYKGHTIYEHIAFQPTPASVSKIWYAPNHVRAWRTTIYKQVGGHNPNLQILDDGELIMRTYLITKFKHIDKCLYLYRISKDGDNTWLKRNKEIQNGVYPLYDQFIYRLVTRWADTHNLPKVDLGGRFSCPEGYKSVDMNGNPDYKFNLNDSWVFKNDSIGVIRAHDVIEHLKDPLHFMKEAFRVLVPGGYLMILVPSTDGRGAFQDPTHISFWNENSFWYYTRKEQAKYIDTPVRFQAVRLVTGYPTEWHKKNKIPYVYAQLQALKGQQVCGGVDI